MDFNEKRDEILKEAYSLNEHDKQSDSFKRNLFSLVEDLVLDLLQSEDAFFGQFMLRIRRDVRFDLKVPIATIPKRDGFNMYFNPFLFLNCSKKEMKALFKHEIYHIMNSHFQRERKMKQSVNKEAIGVALDISINQYIKDLPAYSKKIDGVKMEYNINLSENRSAEEYAEEIYKSIKSRINKNNISKDNDLKFELDITKAHELWEEIDINEEDIEALTQKTAISAYNENTPEGLKYIIKGYEEKAEIPWQTVLKRILPNVKCGYKKTITRRDRRQSERLDLRGRLPKHEIEVIVAIDISASMKEDDLHKILVEVLAITSSIKSKIIVIECDNEIRRVYKLESKKDIKKRSKDNGSTEFTPVFKYIAQNNLKNAILIYFTDGVGEKELGIKPINKKTLWVVSGNEELSLNNSYGEVRRINQDGYQTIERNIGLQMVNEVIHDWAR